MSRRKTALVRFQKNRRMKKKKKSSVSLTVPDCFCFFSFWTCRKQQISEEAVPGRVSSVSPVGSVS